MVRFGINVCDVKLIECATSIQDQYTSGRHDLGRYHVALAISDALRKHTVHSELLASHVHTTFGAQDAIVVHFQSLMLSAQIAENVSRDVSVVTAFTDPYVFHQ